MKLFFIVGPSAVGKMTVGQELAKLTNMRLFHNHQTIELILDTFGYFNKEALNKIRDVIFREFLKTDNVGIIFTFMLAFDIIDEDIKYVNYYKDMYESAGAEFYLVELEASQEERLRRNITENRLLNKKSKRDIESSKNRLLVDDSKHRFNSFEGEITYKNHLKINNESLTPEEVAQIIVKTFNLI